MSFHDLVHCWNLKLTVSSSNDLLKPVLAAGIQVVICFGAPDVWAAVAKLTDHQCRCPRNIWSRHRRSELPLVPGPWRGVSRPSSGGSWLCKSCHAELPTLSRCYRYQFPGQQFPPAPSTNQSLGGVYWCRGKWPPTVEVAFSLETSGTELQNRCFESITNSYHQNAWQAHIRWHSWRMRQDCLSDRLPQRTGPHHTAWIGIVSQNSPEETKMVTPACL